MITTKEKIKSICNYKEETKILPSRVQLMYIDFVIEDSKEIKLEKQRKNRDITIDTILGNKSEEDWSDEFLPFTESTDEFELGVIGPKVQTMNVQSNKFTNYDDLYFDLINFLEKNTQNNCTNLIQCLIIPETTSDDFQTNYRKIVSKIMMASSYIAMTGRIGPATSAIIGRNIFNYLPEGNLSGIEIIYDENIDPDKIICCRSNNHDQSGIILFDNSINNQYFLNGTNNWINQYCWFWVN
jgi:hypothetical protein